MTQIHWTKYVRARTAAPRMTLASANGHRQTGPFAAASRLMLRVQRSQLERLQDRKPTLCRAASQKPNVQVERPAATAHSHGKKPLAGGSARTRGWAACVYVLCKMMRSMMP